MRSLSLFLLLSALAPGCALVHERGAPLVDAGPIARDGWIGQDTGPVPADVGPPPEDTGPPRCPATRPDTTCLASFQVAPDRELFLPYDFDACGCCVETECVTSVDEAQRTIAIDTTLCPDVCDCDACGATHGSCRVPPLAEGTWTVVANGVPAFELPVLADSALIPPPPGCASYADADPCGGALPFAGRVLGEGVCWAPRASTSTLDVLTVVDTCAGCSDAAGPCYATLEPRLTDDLPPGGDLHLVVEQYRTNCELNCPPVCTPLEHTCVVPALVRGDFYRVYLGDVLTGSFVAGETGSCSATP